MYIHVCIHVHNVYMYIYMHASARFKPILRSLKARTCMLHANRTRAYTQTHTHTHMRHISIRWYEVREELEGKDLLADAGIIEVLETARAALMDSSGNVADLMHVSK